jgi:Fe-S-cluster containining protein
MNNTCNRCGGACCKVQLFGTDWLQATGAKEVHYDKEKSQDIVDDHIHIERVCHHLKDGKCSIYETRPRPCREFEVGSRKCFIAMKSKNPKLYAELMNKI